MRETGTWRLRGNRSAGSDRGTAVRSPPALSSASRQPPAPSSASLHASNSPLLFEKRKFRNSRWIYNRKHEIRAKLCIDYRKRNSVSSKANRFLPLTELGDLRINWIYNQNCAIKMWIPRAKMAFFRKRTQIKFPLFIIGVLNDISLISNL